MYEKKIIGVLGCMSPESTVNFYQELIHQCREIGAVYDRDFPEIFIYNLPIPNIFEQVNEEVLEILVDGAKKLESLVDFIVMPCNTAHFYYEEIKKEISIPFLSIMEETVKKIRLMGYDNVGILGTGTTVRGKIYNKDLEKFRIELIIPREQDEVTGIIDHILTGKRLDEDREILKEVIEELKDKGAQAIVLGCTDIPLLLRQEDVDVEVFDSAKILAESTIRFAVQS